MFPLMPVHVMFKFKVCEAFRAFEFSMFCMTVFMDNELTFESKRHFAFDCSSIIGSFFYGYNCAGRGCMAFYTFCDKLCIYVILCVLSCGADKVPS